LDPVKNLKLYSDLIECLINLDYKVDSSLLTYEPVNKVQSDILSSLSSDIRIINHVSAYEYLTQVDILVNTSEYESFGYSLFEALLSGVAVFSTATEGPSEFLIQELSKGYFPGVSNASTLCSAFLNFRESVDREKYISSVESVLNQRSPKMMVSTVLDSLK
jgi:glycosyltransferase involved in cell wall biosynthesis